MSARKERPNRDAAIAPGMSYRDLSAALGVSTAELWRWTKLAALDENEFERRLAEQRAEIHDGKRRHLSAASMLEMNPSRRRDGLRHGVELECPCCGHRFARGPA
jgi:hypothetical protein